MLKNNLPGMSLKLGSYFPLINRRMKELNEINFVSRLWSKDPTLWGKDDPQAQKNIASSLGWLDVVSKIRDKVREINQFAQEILKSGFKQVVHMGMGGSSLAPLTFKKVFSPKASGLPLVVLDTTDPTTIRKIEKNYPLEKTLFINASKSGTTVEPLAFGEYFYFKLKEIKGERAGENFVVITDPGSYLEKVARERQFRKIFAGFPDIGGRFSALSPFGLVPAALLGLDLEKILETANRMMMACSAEKDIEQNEGIILGTILGEMAGQGRDKLTIFLPQPLSSFGLWLEQLLAESTGKEGKGILPIVNEPLGVAESYKEDRLFISYHLQGEFEGTLEQLLNDLEDRKDPIVVIQMRDYFDLFAEMWRWQIATATAGAILQINPFDQPNVQESKENTNSLLKELPKEGKLPTAKPSLKEDSLEFYGMGPGESAQELLQNFLDTRQPGDYFSLLAFLPEEAIIIEAMQMMRRLVRDHLGLATTLGFGPRYLHSTGQFHKGGPNKGLFMMLTAEDKEDIPIPYRPYTFGTLKMAQALGDLEALRRHGQRVLRVHLGSHIESGLEALIEIIKIVLSSRL
ncbi:MAG: hypothetical protein ACPL5I_13935 [Thermodesulfobacteriota bacterium]